MAVVNDGTSTEITKMDLDNNSFIKSVSIKSRNNRL